MRGLAQGTKVATDLGWRGADAVTVGDKVLTFDAGLQTVTRITRTAVWDGEAACPRQFWPLEVPVGALGNREVICLMPNQGVMVESDAAEALFGDPFSLIPAAALEGLNGICRVPPKPGMHTVTLHFNEDQVVFANSGALFHCPSDRDLLEAAFSVLDAPLYHVLPMAQARQLVGYLEAELADQPCAKPQTGANSCVAA